MYAPGTCSLVSLVLNLSFCSNAGLLMHHVQMLFYLFHISEQVSASYTALEAFTFHLVEIHHHLHAIMAEMELLHSKSHVGQAGLLGPSLDGCIDRHSSRLVLIT